MKYRNLLLEDLRESQWLASRSSHKWGGILAADIKSYKEYKKQMISESQFMAGVVGYIIGTLSGIFLMWVFGDNKIK